MHLHHGHPRLRLDRCAVAAMVHLLDAHAAAILPLPSAVPGLHPVPAGELSLAFLTDAALARLHARFLDDPSVTDVITFAGTPASGLAGEICVSADTARAFARKHGRDFSAELTLYLVHGWLHLAGHDDLEPVRKKRMRAAEARAMRLLCAAGEIPRFAFIAPARARP
ncbi:MAG: rRNA maturation RNase YbeY [Opitutaceae bacterium]|nr:rRNA maturation RNase YbeY [Opitutaceae bacterium]